MTPRLAIVCSHPIQYYSPVFSLLARHIDLMVFYTRGKSNYDKGFGIEIEWDICLLKGYKYKILNNIAHHPGTHHFFGIITPEVTKAIHEFAPTHILLYGWAFYTHLKLLFHFHKKAKILFRGDSTLLKPEGRLKSFGKKILLKYIYKHIDTALYTGTENLAYYKAYNLKAQQLIFAPHAIDNQRFSHAENGSAIRNSLGLTKNNILILFTGKFILVKNPELLIRVFRSINIPEAHLLLVGEGPLADQLKTRYRFFKNIHFMPFQNQLAMPAIYKSCDLFCMPSHHESWGLAVNEAMAAGKAVLVSDSVGCATDLVKKSNGRIFKSNNITDFRHKLEQLCQNQEQLNTMGLSSRQIITKWDFETQANHIISALST